MVLVMYDVRSMIADVIISDLWETGFWFSLLAFDLLGRHLCTGFTEPSFACLVIENGFVQVGLAEIRPAHVCEIQLGIGKLVQ